MIVLNRYILNILTFKHAISKKIMGFFTQNKNYTKNELEVVGYFRGNL